MTTVEASAYIHVKVKGKQYFAKVDDNGKRAKQALLAIVKKSEYRQRQIYKHCDYRELQSKHRNAKIHTITKEEGHLVEVSISMFRLSPDYRTVMLLHISMRK